MLCSIFEELVIFHKDNQGAIALAVALQIRPRTRPIAIKYHSFRIFVANGDIEIQHIDTNELIADIFKNR